MRKILLRVLLVVLVLLALLVGAVLLVLPRLVDDERVRQRIEQAARDATGRELRYERLELGLLPPSLRAVDTRLSGETEQDPPLLEAREIALRVALLPLFARSVVVDSLVVEGATLRLVRTEEGLELPQPPPSTDADREAPPEAAEGAGDGETAEHGEADAGFALAVREVALRDTTVVFADRAVSPAVTWQLREIDAELRGRSLDAPVDLDVSARLESGGRLELEGSAEPTPSGRLDLTLRLDGVALTPLAPYLGLGEDVDELAGRLDGTVTLAGPSDAPEKLDARVSADDVRFRRDDLLLRGPVDARLDLSQPTGEADGSFELDLGAAELVMEGTFTKPPGTAARVSGRIVAARDGGAGLALEDVKLVIRNFEARGRVGSLDPLRVELDAEPFDLRGWEALVPALADAAPTGAVSIRGLRYTATPASLTGDVGLDDVTVRSGTTPLVVSGLLRAQGDRVASEGLVARAADQTLDVDARLESLFTSPRYRVDLRAQEADSNALMSSLLSKPDTLFGPLGLDASLRGDLGGDVLHGLDGRIDFGIENGRLKGVSLLRAVTDRLGAAGNLALDLGKAFGGRDLQRFYDDDFELLSGVLDVRDGIARTDALRFVYRGYTATLRGTLALDDLALDMTGDLTLGPEIDQQLAQELSLPDDYAPRERVIPLASVQGTLDAPRVRLAQGTAVRIASAYAGDRYGDRLRKEVEEELGEGSGALVDEGLKILEGVLGGRKKQPSQQEQQQQEQQQ